MNPIAFALRRPVTVLVGLVALIAAGVLASQKMKVDIFPPLNLPVVYVCQPYSGLDPKQMEGLIANYYEYHFLYINGIDHVESRNTQGLSLMKLYFHPETNMAQAMAETVGYVNRARAFMPYGTVPPFIMRFDTGSVPVGYLVLSSKTKTIAQIQDQALFRVRPMFAALPGVSAPPPFGGSQRTIVIRADPNRLRACNVSADDVVRALAAGNSISPSGNIRETERMPIVPVNTMAVTPKDFGDIPVKAGVFLRNVVTRNPGTGEPLIEDASDIPTGYALVNGKRAVYILATKRADASTIDVVNAIKNNLPKMQNALPPDITVSFEFDQSPYVTNAVWGVGIEAGLGAILTGLMVLLFLRDWRSVIVVVLNIPLALIASLTALWLTDLLVSRQTINLMTLGGLALAVGILVDEATVEVENIHTQFDQTDSIALAVRRGNAETAVPRLLAMLCVLAVFLPSFLMEGSAKALFVPLSLAVGFAMIGSYILSSTFVPVASVWLLRKIHTHAHGESWPSRLVGPLAGATTRLRWLVVPIYLIGALGLLALSYWPLGTEIFPQVDSGQFQFRLRAPAGTRIEQTEEIVQKSLEMIKEEFGQDRIAISLGYVGVVPSSYPINGVYQWMGGPEEAVMRVSMKPGTVRISEAKRRLREKLNRELPPWLEKKWLDEGVPADRARRAHDLKMSFEPADIVNEVMSFGSPTPVEIQVSSPSMDNNRAYAAKLYAELQKIPNLKDLQYVQAQDYPTLTVDVNRKKAALSGLQAGPVGSALTPFTSSSRFTAPIFWADPKSGISYQVQVEVPQRLMRSKADIENTPIRLHSDNPYLVRDFADVKEGTMPGEIDRYNMRRLIGITANIEGNDLAAVASSIARRKRPRANRRAACSWTCAGKSRHAKPA